MTTVAAMMQPCSCAYCVPRGGLLRLWRRAWEGMAVTACIMRSQMCARMQNGFHPKDLFDPVEELRQARAANGPKWADEHTKTEAVLDAALQVHDKDSANLGGRLRCERSRGACSVATPSLQPSIFDGCAFGTRWRMRTLCLK